MGVRHRSEDSQCFFVCCYSFERMSTFRTCAGVSPEGRRVVGDGRLGLWVNRPAFNSAIPNLGSFSYPLKFKGLRGLVLGSFQKAYQI